jgi:hypothetical protein
VLGTYKIQAKILSEHSLLSNPALLIERNLVKRKYIGQKIEEEFKCFKKRYPYVCVVPNGALSWWGLPGVPLEKQVPEEAGEHQVVLESRIHCWFWSSTISQNHNCTLISPQAELVLVLTLADT